MKEELTRIKILLERFYDGQTSNEDEQELYVFFRRDNIPDELISHKPVIQYFETGLADEFGCAFAEEAGLPFRSVKMQKIRSRLILWSSVAASFLLILFSSVYFLTAKEPSDPYAGSYIIRNGVRITDLDLIRPELEAAIQKSLLLEQEADRLVEQLSMIDDSREMQIMQQLQDHHQRILDNMQDETIRNEMKEILNLNI